MHCKHIDNEVSNNTRCIVTRKHLINGFSLLNDDEILPTNILLLPNDFASKLKQLHNLFLLLPEINYSHARSNTLKRHSAPFVFRCFCLFYSSFRALVAIRELNPMTLYLRFCCSKCPLQIPLIVASKLPLVFYKNFRDGR